MHLKGADGTAGVADGHNPLGNVMDHHAAPADDGAAADGDAGQNGDAPADPNAVPHGDGLGVLQLLVPEGVVQGVGGGVEAAVGGDMTLLPKVMGAQSSITQL